jgi:hypothetical protein
VSVLRKLLIGILCGIAGVATLSAIAAETPPQTAPAGDAKSAQTKTLESAAKTLQNSSPLAGFDIYLDGFHPLKKNPGQQMESHHYCHQVNQDFAQCVLFDGNTEESNMNGVEYIISEKLFNSLPEKEKKFWHPHNGEILSGQLVAPGIPEAAENALMKDKINSYGKTWHFWNTGHEGHSAADRLPLGEPMLAWSFNRDGEALPGLIEKRDGRIEVDSARIREERAELVKLAKPQSGVDALKGSFGRPTQDIAGVVEK